MRTDSTDSASPTTTDDRLLDAALAQLGFRAAGYRLARSVPRARLRALVRATGLSDDAYLERLAFDPALRREAEREVTVTHARFFRDRALWEHLRDHLLPAIVRQRAEARIWSAGCAAGEEAASLAILLHDMPIPSGHDYHILATDVREDGLERAHRGIYPRSSLRPVAAAIRARCFEPVAEGFLLADAIRQRIHMAPHDLLHDPWPREIDLLLLRNLAFTCWGEELQVEVLGRIAEVLREHAWLAIGAGEELPAAGARRFERVAAGLPLFRLRY